ncbi:MAG: hypothetical protein M3O07_05675, partial [Pseudomonadota bacterium]|nr:hypothetical protein [Pseudomonadota bacterium]
AIRPVTTANNSPIERSLGNSIFVWRTIFVTLAHAPYCGEIKYLGLLVLDESWGSCRGRRPAPFGALSDSDFGNSSIT